MIVLAIDPGNIESAFVLWSGGKCLDKGKIPNEKLLKKNWHIIGSIEIAIEMVSSYGMAVGQEVFDTCVWIGIFKSHFEQLYNCKVKLIFRKTIKMHHCHSVRAKDGEVNVVLRQKYGEDNTVKVANEVYWNEIVEFNNGAKYMNGDIWSAFALATYMTEPKDYPIKNLQEREENKLTRNLLN